MPESTKEVFAVTYKGVQWGPDFFLSSDAITLYNACKVAPIVDITKLSVIRRVTSVKEFSYHPFRANP